MVLMFRGWWLVVSVEFARYPREGGGPQSVIPDSIGNPCIGMKSTG